MPPKETLEEHRGSTLRLPVSTRFVDLRNAHRHVFWHRRRVLAVAFYRLIVGLESRTDLIIFGSGLVIGLALYMSATDIPALAASSAARSRRPFVTIRATGAHVQDSEGSGHVDWSSLKQVCFTSCALVIELPQRTVVVSLSDISSSELRRLRRLLVTRHVCTCQAEEAAALTHDHSRA
jgi:hypothetical protein